MKKLCINSKNFLCQNKLILTCYNMSEQISLDAIRKVNPESEAEPLHNNMSPFKMEVRYKHQICGDT